MNAFDLNGRVALVTGGNGGIGLAMAEGLARAGAAVMVAARDTSKSKQAVGELEALGAQAAAVAVDVTDPRSCAEMVTRTVAAFGRLDILVNNAGINIRKQPETFTPSEWRTVIATNLDGAFYCAQAAFPALEGSGYGKVINIGSMLSLFGASFAAPYAAAKGGIVQLTKALACAWAPHRIQVNAVLPGWIDTDLTRKGRAQIPGLHERVLARTPAGRWGTPHDMAGIAAFLASSASDFVTGTAIPVDGGFSIGI